MTVTLDDLIDLAPILALSLALGWFAGLGWPSYLMTGNWLALTGAAFGLGQVNGVGDLWSGQ